MCIQILDSALVKTLGLYQWDPRLRNAWRGYLVGALSAWWRLQSRLRWIHDSSLYVGFSLRHVSTSNWWNVVNFYFFIFINLAKSTTKSIPFFSHRVHSSQHVQINKKWTKKINTFLSIFCWFGHRFSSSAIF